MARLSLGAVVAPRGMLRLRRRRRLTAMQLLAALLLLLLLSIAVASSFASPIDPGDAADDEDADDINNPRALFERSYFQLPAHLREAARADLGGVEFDRGLYSGEEKNKRGDKKKKTKTKKKAKEVDAASSTSSAEEKTTSTSTSSSASSSSAAAAAAAAAALPRQAAGEHVKVMIVQPDAQQMEAIMRGEQVK